MRLAAIIIICLAGLSFTLVSSITWEGGQRDIPKNFEKIVNRKLAKHFNSENITLTKSRELMNSTTKSNTPYYSVLNEKNELLAYFVFNITDACSFGGCSISNEPKSSSVFHDKIYYYVLLNTDFTVNHIRVLEHESSYGMEIGTRYWLKQFFNTTPGNYKLNENIDGISGATVSVQAMIDDLNRLQLE